MRFEKTEITHLESFDEYLDSLGSPIDNFLEDHILNSDIYRISMDAEETGSFAIYDKYLLTQFYLRNSARKHSQQCLSEILEKTAIKTAFVPTFDQFLLSHVFDYDAKITNQAYFFCEANPDEDLSRTPETLLFRHATVSDASLIRRIGADFVPDPEEDSEAGRLHLGFLKGELVSIGIVVRGKLRPATASIGMFTNQLFRRQGFGAQTIRYLRKVCHQDQIMPICGCWYYNHLSKRTLEAAGMVASSRLLKIEVSEARYGKNPG